MYKDKNIYKLPQANFQEIENPRWHGTHVKMTHFPMYQFGFQPIITDQPITVVPSILSDLVSTL